MDKKLPLLVIALGMIVSFVCVYVFFDMNIILAYFDANTRLNIARRIFDNLTPGIAQIGNVWLPFPQILFIPFVTNDFLWRSGLAGWFVSGTIYVITGLLLYKTTDTLTEDKYTSVIAALFFLLNINVMYLQTTAMSEIFFIFTLVLIYYLFVKFQKTHNISYLLKLGLAVFLSTLTRYEGYAILGGVTIALAGYLFFSEVFRRRTEGLLLLYLLPAVFGILIWSFYLWAIFGDPLYWLHYYADVAVPATTSDIKPVVTRPHILEALWIYTQSVIHMNGLLTVIVGALGTVYFVVSKRYKLAEKTILMIPLFILIFMMLTLSRNTPIEQPSISLSTFLSKDVNKLKEFNIRYGLNMLVFLIVPAAILFSRHIILKGLITAILLFQFGTYFITPIYTTYQLWKSVSYGIEKHSIWMNTHYDGGLILISAAEHDPEMIQMRFPYKVFIHEGTQKYWSESLRDPSKYAEWIIFNLNDERDRVGVAMKELNLVDYNFELVYQDPKINIYKRRD